MRGMTRRQVLIGGAAGAATLAAQRAWGQQKELVANTYGGGWEQGHRQAIAEPIEKKTGAKVILISMLANELVARVKAAGGSKPARGFSHGDRGRGAERTLAEADRRHRARTPRRPRPARPPRSRLRAAPRSYRAARAG